MNDDANEITCSICLSDETEMDVKIVQCSHKFHRHFIVKWIETCAKQTYLSNALIALDC